MNLLTAFNLRLTPQRPEVVSVVGGGGKSSTMFQMADEIAVLGHRVITTTTTNIGPGQVINAPSVLRVEDDQLSFDALKKLLDAHQHCLLVSPEKEATRGYKVSGVSPKLVDTLAMRAAELGVSAIVVEADGSHRLPIKAPAPYEPVVADSTTVLVPVAGLDCLGTPITKEYVHRPERVRSVLELDIDFQKNFAPSQHLKTWLRPGSAKQYRTFSGKFMGGEVEHLSPEMIAELLLSPTGGAKLRPQDAQFRPMVTKVDTAPRLAAARLIANVATACKTTLFIASIVREAAQQEISEAAKGPILERWGPTVTVILAAGQSKRMGRPKQLEIVDGEPMIIRAVQTALQGSDQRVVVVVGAYADLVQERLSTLPDLERERLMIVDNPQWMNGQASSVRRAIEFLTADLSIEAALFMPVDQPFIEPLLLRRFIRKWQLGARLVAPQLDGKPRGAPALFDRSLWSEMQNLSGDTGAKSLLKKYSAELQVVPASAKQLFDIDSPDDIFSAPS